MFLFGAAGNRARKAPPRLRSAARRDNRHRWPSCGWPAGRPRAAARRRPAPARRPAAAPGPAVRCSWAPAGHLDGRLQRMRPRAVQHPAVERSRRIDVSGHQLSPSWNPSCGGTIRCPSSAILVYSDWTNAMTNGTNTNLLPATDGRWFRKVAAHFASGVAVVTSVADDVPVGTTVNAFTTVSLDPALLLARCGSIPDCCPVSRNPGSSRRPSSVPTSVVRPGGSPTRPGRPAWPPSPESGPDRRRPPAARCWPMASPTSTAASTRLPRRRPCDRPG